VDEKTLVRGPLRKTPRRRRASATRASTRTASSVREAAALADRSGSLIRLRPTTYGHVVSRDRAVLLTGDDGFVGGGADEGWFVHETRLLSRYRWLVEGEPLRPIVLSNVEQDSWLGYYAWSPLVARGGYVDEGSGMLAALSERTVGFRVQRELRGELHERIEIENHSEERVSFRFELELDGDFADLQETRGRRRARGSVGCRFRARGASAELALVFLARHRPRGAARPRRTVRELRLELHGAPVARFRSRGSRRPARISYRVELAPRATWRLSMRAEARIDGRSAPTSGISSWGPDDLPAGATRFETGDTGTLSSVVAGALERARSDLAALRLRDYDGERGSWLPAAGVPIYVAYFGRDTLTAGWQAALLGPEAMHGSLVAAARHQGTRVDDWRDEQPGRMPHELHTGPLGMLGYHPRDRYYGAATTSAFYPLVLASLWHWTGDRELVRPWIVPALEALEWLDRYGDLDGDGLYEYLSRSTQGVAHQGWKDSADAIVRTDGSRVDPPVATCEEQAFAYVAKAFLAELLWRLGEKQEAKRLFREARDLKRRFDAAFWMEDEGFYALALDVDKRQVRAISSNPGHCLASGIVPRERARRVADRLLSPELFSGWGVRTLSRENPAYNPYSYHRGSIWPVEQASFALAFWRYGLREHLERLCRAIFESTALFDHFRLPEVFSGHPRDAEHPFPSLYPKANSPQAWSASSVVMAVQAMLGIYPYAPLGLLLVDPHLPPWLPEITLRGLRVGGAVCDLRFRRLRSGVTRHEVLAVRGKLRVLRQPSPWSVTAGAGERLLDATRTVRWGARRPWARQPRSGTTKGSR
jgi:glycogen debranching enzyme